MLLLWTYLSDILLAKLHERLDAPPSGQCYIYSRECASAKFSETQLHSAVCAIYNGLSCPYKVQLDRPIIYLPHG